MNKTVKWILISVAIIIGIAIIIYAIRSFFPQPVAPGVPPPPGGPAQVNPIDAIISGLGGWLQNLFTGNQCDPQHPGYTKSGKRDTKCDSVTYDPSVSLCNPNLCDPARPGYDQCGGFKMGC